MSLAQTTWAAVRAALDAEDVDDGVVLPKTPFAAPEDVAIAALALSDAALGRAAFAAVRRRSAAARAGRLPRRASGGGRHSRGQVRLRGARRAPPPPPPPERSRGPALAVVPSVRI